MFCPRISEECFHTNSAKTVETVQYLSWKYRGKISLHRRVKTYIHNCPEAFLLSPLICLFDLAVLAS